MGRSRCGLRVSCAAVETASKPMYAKKTIVAPWRTPEMPYLPKVPSFGGTKGCQFAVFTKRAAKAMKSRTTVTFDEDDDRVEARRLLDAAHEQRGHREDDEHRGHVEVRAGRLEGCGSFQTNGRVDPAVRQVDAEGVVEERDDVARPADADGRRADQVFEDEVPADDPGDELAHRRVRVRVRAARDGDHRRHLGVAEARERRGDARDDEGERDRRPGVGRGGASGEHEDAGADDGADAEHDQVERRERALHAVVGLGVAAQLVDRLGGKKRVRDAHRRPSLTPAAPARIHGRTRAAACRSRLALAHAARRRGHEGDGEGAARAAGARSCRSDARGGCG